MTNREFLSAIAERKEMTDELVEFAKKEIEKMDNANAKRRNTPSKKAIENEPLLAKIETELLSETGITAAEVAAVLETSVQKASSLLRTLVANGKANVSDVKVPKRGVQKSYTRVAE